MNNRFKQLQTQTVRCTYFLLFLQELRELQKLILPRKVKKQIARITDRFI